MIISVRSDEAQSTPPPKKRGKKICKLDLGLLCNLSQNLQLEPKVRKAYLLAITINVSRLMTQPAKKVRVTFKTSSMLEKAATMK